MDPTRAYLVQTVASTVLRRKGIAAVWRLQVLAAELHRTGHLRSAQVMLDIADESERTWLNRPQVT